MKTSSYAEKQKLRLVPFRYSAEYNRWRSARMVGDAELEAEKHREYIEAKFGKLKDRTRHTPLNPLRLVPYWVWWRKEVA